jgi:hypothetical protein
MVTTGNGDGWGDPRHDRRVTADPALVSVDLDHGGRWTSLRLGGREWLMSRDEPRRPRVAPGDPFADAGGIEEYAEVNNFGTTRVLRAFAPQLRDNGRLIVVASSFATLQHLAPVLHDRFDGLASLDEVDKQVAAWRDAVKDGSARAGAWPGFINIPSKIGQVAAVSTLAAQRREQDTARGILLAAVCPGMMNTLTSAEWWDVSDAPSPAQAAVALLDLALGPVTPGHYGQLIRHGEVLPWAPRG